jgi:hypothetical protein
MSLSTPLARVRPGQDARHRLAALDAEVAALRAALAAAQAQVAQFQAEPAAQQRIAELASAGQPVPPAVRPAFTQPSTPRRRRDPAPTQVVPHPIEHCPVCSVRLRGVHVERQRQVIELPPLPPVETTAHQVYAG